MYYLEFVHGVGYLWFLFCFIIFIILLHLVFVFLSFGIFLKDSSVTCLFDLFTLFHIFLNFFFFWYFPYFFFLFCCNLYFFPPLSFGSLMQIYMVNSPFFPIFEKILFKISVSSFLNVY